MTTFPFICVSPRPPLAIASPPMTTSPPWAVPIVTDLDWSPMTTFPFVCVSPRPPSTIASPPLIKLAPPRSFVSPPLLVANWPSKTNESPSALLVDALALTKILSFSDNPLSLTISGDTSSESPSFNVLTPLELTRTFPTSTATFPGRMLIKEFDPLAAARRRRWRRRRSPPGVLPSSSFVSSSVL